MYPKYFIYSDLFFICTSFNVRKEKCVLLQIIQTFSLKFRLRLKVKEKKWTRPRMLCGLTRSGSKDFLAQKQLRRTRKIKRERVAE